MRSKSQVNHWANRPGFRFSTAALTIGFLAFLYPALPGAETAEMVPSADAIGESTSTPAAVIDPATDPRLDPSRIALAGEPVNMTLAQVVMLAFQENLDIEISLKDLQISDDIRRGEQGIYDPVLGATTGYRKIEGKSNQSISGTTLGTGAAKYIADDGAIVIDQHSEEVSASLSQLVPTGATISLGVDRARTDYEDIRQLSNPVNPEEAQRAFVRVRQPLLKNFGPTVTNLGIRTSKLEQKISGALYRQQVENQLAEVMAAYWDLTFAIRNLEVQRTSLEAALELERVNEVRVRTGSAPRSDLFQAQAQVAARRNNVITGKSAILAAQDRLLRLVNWSEPIQNWDRPIVPLDRPNAYNLDTVYDDEQTVSQALTNRNDLKATRLSMDIAETTKDALWWQRFPELNAIAEYGLNGLSDSSRESTREITDGTYEDYYVGLEFRYPLLNRKARADYRRSKKQVERTELNIQRLELAVSTQVRGATRAIRTAQESIEASDSQVRAAEETLNSERKRLDVGSSTTFNVLDFQEKLAQAQVSQVLARVNYQKGLIELERSRGSLIDTIGNSLGLAIDFDALAAEDQKQN